MTHTAGPWKLCPECTGQMPEAIAELSRLHIINRDLLEALEALVKANYGQPRGVTVPALNQARAAIAKAKS